jgi:hypothetical protein
MKIRNYILAMAVAAVAGVNVYLANDLRVQRNELSLLNLENIADADETNPGDCGQSTSIESFYKGDKLWGTITSDGHCLTGYCSEPWEHECTVSYRGATFNGGSGMFNVVSCS